MSHTDYFYAHERTTLVIAPLAQCAGGQVLSGTSNWSTGGRRVQLQQGKEGGVENRSWRSSRREDRLGLKEGDRSEPGELNSTQWTIGRASGRCCHCCVDISGTPLYSPYSPWTGLVLVLRMGQAGRVSLLASGATLCLSNAHGHAMHVRPPVCPST